GLLNLSYFDEHGREIVVFCPESKDSEATQHPQRKSLSRVRIRKVEPPFDNAVSEPATQTPITLPQPQTSADAADEKSLAEVLRGGESATVEFKSSLRVNLHTRNRDAKIEHAVLKTIAAFLNSDGGILVVGVDDKGIPLGLDADGFQSEDKMLQHLA